MSKTKSRTSDQAVDGPESKQAGLTKKLALAGASLLVSLVAAEVVLRFLPPVVLGFEYRDHRFRTPDEYATDSTKNQLGFHDVEHGPKRPGTTRILLLGDSYVGLRVPLPMTIGRRLARHTGCEVVACGIAGWGQREQLGVLDVLGPGLGPDVVITLFLPFNDVRDNSTTLDERLYHQWENMVVNRPGWANFRGADAPGLLFERSVLNQLISHRLYLWTGQTDEIPLDYFVYRDEYDDDWLEAWRITEDLLLKTRDHAERLGAAYLLVSASTPHGVLGPKKGLEFIERSYPAMREMGWDLDGPNARLRRFCEANDIPFLSLEPAFRRHVAETGERLHWKYNGHWNEAGNDLAARLMAEFIPSHTDDATPHR